MTETRVVHVDWFRVLADLQRAGYGLPMVASVLGLNADTLRTYRNRGCVPNYGYGRAIVGLWCQVMGRAEAQLPELLEAPLSAAQASKVMSRAEIEFRRRQLDLLES